MDRDIIARMLNMTEIMPQYSIICKFPHNLNDLVPDLLRCDSTSTMPLQVDLPMSWGVPASSRPTRVSPSYRAQQGQQHQHRGLSLGDLNSRKITYKHEILILTNLTETFSLA